MSRLLFSAKDKKVYIKTKDDKLLDAATGKPAEGAAARRYRRGPRSITGCAALSTRRSAD